MTVGTKSLLFGVHQFILHPLLVWLSWVKLYGLKVVRCNSSGVRTQAFDPRLWLACLLHDIGYWGCPEMDGPWGSRHPQLGARMIRLLVSPKWYWFLLCHSRTQAKRVGQEPSALCWPDKYSIVMYPNWLYLFLGNLSGEIEEYQKHGEDEYGISKNRWMDWVKERMRQSALEGARRVLG